MGFAAGYGRVRLTSASMFCDRNVPGDEDVEPVSGGVYI